MLYKKNQSKKLSRELFENPTSEYRATPFWAWNCELKPELLEKEIDYMKEMGFGGFHMHPRVGMATPYLTDDFMKLIKGCVEKARKENMLAWLYDEDKWPSGFAGGYVTKNPENREKMLYITAVPYDDGTLVCEKDKSVARTKNIPDTHRLIAVFDIELDGNGCLSGYKKIGLGDDAEHCKWFVYIEYMNNSSWYNGQAYADTLSKKTIEEFVEVTHEKYKKEVGADFGGVVPAIFTDEPQFATKKALNFPEDKNGITLPYTTDFEDTFKAAYGVSLLDHIPELVWELPDGKISTVRYYYHDHVAERFAEAFADTIGGWCEKNGIMLTGHLMNEPSLRSQTMSLGDAMRSYRSFQLPGIDMLADMRELTTAKQAQSAVHQYGRPGVLSELYGVTNWNFDFKGHKLQGDWQAALGVSVRVPHLFWVSMGGEGKRDYPAAIGYQSPWYKDYKYIEDHFARVNTVMTRGKPEVKLGVVHPVESYWLHWGPMQQTSTLRDDLQTRFTEITEWLLYGLCDFDFICESLLPSQYKESDKGFTLGEMNYDAVVVPYCETIRSTTLEALKKFRAKGGKVIFMGKAPRLVDAVPSDEAEIFASECVKIDWSRSELYREVEPERVIDIRDLNGSYSDNLIYQLRDDGEVKHLFISHVRHPREYDVTPLESYIVKLSGEWKLTELDTLTGKTRELAGEYKGGNTFFKWACCRDSSLLLELEPGKRTEGAVFTHPSYTDVYTLSQTVRLRREEPNVLLFDRPAYAIDDGDLMGPLNILKADDDIRTRLGMRHRDGAMIQPWVTPPDRTAKAKVTLNYSFDSEIEYYGSELALESVSFAQAYLNSEKVDMTPVGYYVDEDSIAKVRLPMIKKGTNELKLEYSFCDKTQLETCFILGDFGVKLNGVNQTLTSPEAVSGYGDIIWHGMPFYGGNLVYETEFETDGRAVTLEISRFRASAVRVIVDGDKKGLIAFPPNRLSLGALEKGKHKLELVMLGNRMNTFGSVHNVDKVIPYCGPGAWRTRDRFFTDAYLLHETGIITAPRILTEE